MTRSDAIPRRDTDARRVLYVAVSQGHLAVFHRPYLRWLRERGYVVDIAAGASTGFAVPEADHVHEIAFARSPFSRRNWLAFRRLRQLMRDNRYTLVHCHTPVASALSRLAARCNKDRPVVMYTAHGFHFYPAAPLRNWLIWFPLEWALTRVTDVLVTINHWDYRAARRKLRARTARLIPGIGVDLQRFVPWAEAQRTAKRDELGIPADAFVIIYIAEFIPRKNHAFLISALDRIRMEVPTVRLLLAGDGPLQDEVWAECERRGLADRVQMLGFRRDIPDLANTAELAVSSSRHEGLPIGLAEVMACGVPIVASEDRGHRELVVEGTNGHIFAQDDEDAFVQHVILLAKNAPQRKAMGRAAREHVQRFSIEAALPAMARIYEEAEQIAAFSGEFGRKRGGRVYGACKRLVDFSATACAMIVAAPIVAAAALLVWLEDRSGSPFIRQERLGRGERPFGLIKLRTMRTTRFRNGRKLTDAERLLRTGRIFRKYSIDELPQFINVLRGEMSLIGPRPMPIAYQPYLTPIEHQRHRVRPGMSGLAQIEGRNFLSWDKKFALDVEYVRQFGWRIDCRILLKTLLQLVRPADVGVRGLDLPVQSLHEIREPWPAPGAEAQLVEPAQAG